MDKYVNQIIPFVPSKIIKEGETKTGSKWRIYEGAHFETSETISGNSFSDLALNEKVYVEVKKGEKGFNLTKKDKPATEPTVPEEPKVQAQPPVEPASKEVAKAPPGDPPKAKSVVDKLAEKYGDMISADALNLLYTTGFIPQNCPANIVALWLESCRLVGISPIHRPFYLIPYGGYDDNDQWVTKFQQVVNINTMLAQAHKSKEFAGIDEAVFDDKRASYLILHEAKTGSAFNVLKNSADQDVVCPTTCTVTVYRFVQGQRIAFTATVTWESRYPGKTKPKPNKPAKEKNPKWLVDPWGMLAKCAKAAALRDGFSDWLMGMYLEEEMESTMNGGEAGNDMITRDSLIQEMQNAAAAGNEAELKSIWQENQKFSRDPEFILANQEAWRIIGELKKQNGEAA